MSLLRSIIGLLLFFAVIGFLLSYLGVGGPGNEAISLLDRLAELAFVPGDALLSAIGVRSTLLAVCGLYLALYVLTDVLSRHSYGRRAH